MSATRAIHDLTCANEEIRSSNEELQSINEEIETSKEEVEAANEELNTVNDELASRNLELARLSDDLSNVLMSAAIPILMVDNDLRIRRSTAAAEDLLNIRASDVGRSIGEIRLLLSVEDVEPLIRRVIETLEPQELEVQDRKRCWRILRIRPYRTSDNRIEGAVLVLIDIDALHTLHLATEQARKFAESVTESVRTPLAVLDRKWQIRSVNRSFIEAFGGSTGDLHGRNFFSFRGCMWKSSELGRALERVVTERIALDDFEIEVPARRNGPGFLAVSARVVEANGDSEVLVAIDDISQRKTSEAQVSSERTSMRTRIAAGSRKLAVAERGLKKETADRERTETALQDSESALVRSREELRALTARLFQVQDEERRRISRELHDGLSQKVAKLQFDVERLQMGKRLGMTETADRLESLRRTDRDTVRGRSRNCASASSLQSGPPRTERCPAVILPRIRKAGDSAGAISRGGSAKKGFGRHYQRYLSDCPGSSAEHCEACRQNNGLGHPDSYEKSTPAPDTR